MLKIIRSLKQRRRTRKIALVIEFFLSFVVVAWSGLVDSEWYRMQSGLRRPLPRLIAAAHYIFRGRRRGHSPHPLFEPEYFDPEGWRKSGLDPFAKYLRNPKNWRKPTHPWFDGSVHMNAAPEARSHRWGPLGHFLASASPQAPLPVARPTSGSTAPTWNAGRSVLFDQLRSHLHEEHLRREVRVSATYDRRRESRFRHRWQSAPLPEADSGAPIVSVVLPVWNRAEAVQAAIASVQAQTLADWELLVVDDGSTDGTAAVVEAIAATDRRIKLFRQPHGGVCRARNRGLDHACGRYVAFLDSDNTFRPYFLRTALAAMSGQGWRLAYAAMEIRDGRMVRYRALDAGREQLQIRNHIDLNVVVAERALVDEVGRFDEQLRRTVDYDLVLRMDRVYPIRYLPFVGTIHDHSDGDPDRITTREPNSWLEVVQNKNFIDWPAQTSGRVEGRISVLVPTYEDWRFTEQCLQSLIGESGAHDLEIVVLDNASRRSVGSILRALSATNPRIRLVREPTNRNFALGSNLAFAESTGETVLFINNDTEVQPGWLEPLLAALDNQNVLAAQPLLLYADGSIQCAGVAFVARSVFPVPFLAHHPMEDARRVGRSFFVSALTGAAIALRAEDFAALRGFDPIYRNGWEDIDLCLRLSQLRPGSFVVSTDSVVIHSEGKAGGRSKHTTNRKIFRERWRGRVPPGDEHLWQAAGFTVTHYQVDKSPGRARPELARPVLTRETGQVLDGPAKGEPAFRWAIKIGAPAGRAGLWWGDRHFARALGAALEGLGQQVVIDSRGAADRDSSYLDDVVLVLRGLVSVVPQPGRVNLLWVISHPDLVQPEEMSSYDAAFAASPQWAARMSGDLGYPVETLLQCTDPARFHPGVAKPDTGDRVLFIGNSRNVVRPIVHDAIEAGADVAIYGTLWDRFIDRRYIRGTYLPNKQVPAAYRSAGVLLNDHWDDMRREGFLSNRLFDAAAVGARVVSDEMPGLEEVFGALVRTYRTVDELRDVLTRPEEAFPAEEERLRLAERVRREHSFDVRARALLDAAVRLWKQ